MRGSARSLSVRRHCLSAVSQLMELPSVGEGDIRIAR